MSNSATVQAHIACPVCGSHDAAALYSDGHLYCFSCQSNIAGEATGAKRTHMPAELIKDIEYLPLTARDLTIDTCRKFSYGVADDGTNVWQVATYYDQNGEPVAQHLRGKDKTFRWRGSPQNVKLYGQQLWNDHGKMVIVTEGEIDCLSVSQVQGNRWPVVSVPNGVTSAVRAFKDNLEWLESFEKVVICFDMDEPGRKAANEAAQVLSPGKAFIMHLPLKDPNDMLKAGKTAELISAIWSAAPYRPDGIVSGIELWDELTKAPEKGYATPFPKLNTMTDGIRKKELWLFTAGSGIGKSTVVHEIAYHFMTQHKLTIGVMALEESKRRAAERYLSIYLNKPLHLTREGVSEEALKDAYDHTIGQEGRFYLYDHFGSTDIDTLMSRIRYMAVSCAIDFLVLDHISIVVSGLRDAGESERKQIDMLMTALRSLVEDTGIGVLGVVHLKRPAQGASWNDGKEPALTDLRGSGGLEQLSDMVVSLSRNQQDEETGNYSRLNVLKNRFTGVVGTADTLLYDNRTGRLLAVQDKDDPFREENRGNVFENNVKEQDTQWPLRVSEQRRASAPAQTDAGRKTEKSVEQPLEGEVDF